MAATTSRLRSRMSTEAVNNGGQPWTAQETLAEILIDALTGTVANDEYVSTPTSLAGAGFTIVAGALSWSVTVVSGTVTIGGVTWPAGGTVRGGGYGRLTTKSGIFVDATAGSAVLLVDRLG